jgi:hypothetical protein
MEFRFMSSARRYLGALGIKIGADPCLTSNKHRRKVLRSCARAVISGFIRE